MRKRLAIAVGSTLVCGVLTALLFALPPAPTEVTINGDLQTGGVDTPWFTLSRQAGDKVRWKNLTSVSCSVEMGPHSPFPVEPIPVAANGGVSPEYDAAKAPPHPKGWPKGKVYKMYKYSVKCDGVIFDPGWGVTP